MRFLALLLLTAVSLFGQHDFTDLPFLAQANRSGPAPFTPLLVPGMVFWYQAQDYAAQANGTGLTTVLDKSTSQNHGTNPVAKLAPILTNGVLNGKSAFVFFNASNTFLEISNTAPFGGTQEGELFAVMRSEATPAADSSVGSCWQMENVSVAATDLRSVQTWANGGGVPTTNAISEAFGAKCAGWAAFPNNQLASNWHVFSVSVKSNDMAMRVNGEIFGGNHNTGATGFTNRVRIGRNARSGAAVYFSGQIADIMAFSNVLSSANRKLVTDYLGGLYGIAVTNAADTYTPTNFQFLTGWWDADQFANVLPPNTTVSNWPNLMASVKVMTWTNVVAANQPLWVSNAVNGHAVLRWDNSLSPLLFMNPRSSFITNRVASEPSSLIFVMSSTNGLVRTFSHTGHTWSLSWPNGAGGISIDFTTQASTMTGNNFPWTMTNISAHFWSRDMVGNVQLWNNLTNCSVLQTNLGEWSVDRLGVAGSQDISGDLCEVIYYRTNLPPDAYVKLYETYLKPKWGLP